MKRKSDSDILTEYINENYIDCIECDTHTRLLIADTFDFKLYLLKVRIKEFIDLILRRN